MLKLISSLLLVLLLSLVLVQVAGSGLDNVEELKAGTCAVVALGRELDVSGPLGPEVEGELLLLVAGYLPVVGQSPLHHLVPVGAVGG